MEGFKFFIFLMVALIWLAFWIIRLFRKAFNQPAAKNVKPFKPKPHTSLEEMLRQHLPKTEEEIQKRAASGSVQPMKAEKLEKRSLESDRPKYRSLEVLEPRRRSLEKLEPLVSTQDYKLSENIAQREDIIRQRRVNNIYQESDKKAVSVYAKMLRNPENARNAVVLAEILKRKF